MTASIAPTAPPEVRSGLEGVVAFATTIAEPDREGGALRYRGVALEELRARKPDRVLATNVEFWSAVVLDVADVPPQLAPAMFACSRTAGWSAHILEQKRLNRLVRPSARYVGPAARSFSAV